ncbi:MAG: BBP7 family outer membrane beta-barrel protein [Planctomyces sp.]|nr:BBP7 family outer membrane beta-barrel protein [Planctomyces sp.]
MPWRFILSLATLLLAATGGSAVAQAPGYAAPGWTPSYGPQGLPYDCPPGMAPGAPQQVGEQGGWLYDDDSRVDMILRETVRHSWFRLEYLNWEIQRPGNKLLGAPLATQDARDGFPAIDPGNIPRIGVEAFVPDLGDVQLNNLNGIRGTVGIPTLLGVFEADAWALGQAADSTRIRPAINFQTGATIIPAISLESVGLPSDSTMVLFDTDYRHEWRSNLFGAQANFVFNPVTPEQGASLRPLLGIRYVRFDEELQIRGIDSETGTNPRIRSEANNNLVGPQFGLRGQLDSKWISLGIEPKIMLGINRHEDSVAAEQILDPTNSARSHDNATDFAPVFDLSAYGKLHLSRNFSLFAGYELLVLTNVTRPGSQIDYNAPLVVTDPPLIRLTKDRESVVVHGMMVGGELRFR